MSRISGGIKLGGLSTALRVGRSANSLDFQGAVMSSCIPPL